MIYEDDYGEEVDTTKLYKCRHCSWVGTVEEMVWCADCSDPYDAVYSNYCCPECLEFYLFLSRWNEYDHIF